MFEFDYLIFIGRFQPFHLAHYAVVNTALQRAQNVIILLGSAQPEEGFSETSFRPDAGLGLHPQRTTKNVFTVDERQQMILAAFPEHQQRIHFAGLIDVFNDVKWTKMVKAAVAEIVYGTSQAEGSLQADGSPQAEGSSKKVGLIGHFKDQSSYYLSLFPEWPLVELDNFYDMSATPMRERYLQGQLPSLSEVPESTLDFLTQFQHSAMYKNLCNTD
jgi:bifunctional NMN adenylyltransferase/nudix hydrolase